MEGVDESPRCLDRVVVTRVDDVEGMLDFHEDLVVQAGQELAHTGSVPEEDLTFGEHGAALQVLLGAFEALEELSSK